MFNHAGMTGGFTLIALGRPERKAAIVVLSNAAGQTPDDIAPASAGTDNPDQGRCQATNRRQR